MGYKILTIFIVVAFIFSGCSASIKNLDNQGQNIICFGDSITKGQDAIPNNSYPEILEKMIKKKITNAGVSGDTTASALKRLESAVLNKNPRLVIVELGGNDFLRKIPKKTTLKNLEIIILKIQKTGSAVAICDISSGFIFSSYRKNFKILAKKTGSIFIPSLLEGVLDNPALKYDHIHPNASGYNLIAQRIYKEITKYFNFDK